MLHLLETRCWRCSVCYMLRCKHLHDRCDKSDLFFSDFISLLGCFRGISAKSSKQYYLKFPGKYFFLLTIFRMDLFRAAHGLGCKNAHLHKICHTYPTMMKLSTVTPYLTKIQNIYKHVTHLLSFADISTFSPKITRTFVISRNTDIDCISIYNC